MSSRRIIDRQHARPPWRPSNAIWPSGGRSAVILHDIEGLAYEEIAQSESIPLGTVKSRIFNARVALREHLRPYLEA